MSFILLFVLLFPRLRELHSILREHRYYSHVDPGTFYLPFSQGSSDVSYLPAYVVPRAESVLASYCFVPNAVYLLLPILRIPFNKNNADAAEITLRREMKNGRQAREKKGRSAQTAS